MKFASLVGIKRMLDSVHKGHEDGKERKSEAERLGVDIVGTFGELALCKIMDWRWGCSVGSYKKPDARKNIEIRTNTHHNGHLIIKPNDDLSNVFVLMVGEAPTYRAAGWIFGREADSMCEPRQPKGFKKPCYFVEQHDLNPMDTLQSVTI